MTRSVRFAASTTRRTIDEPVPGATGLTAAMINRRRPTTDAEAAPTEGAGRADTLVTTLPSGNYYLLGTIGGVQLWRADTPKMDPGNASLGVAAGRAAAADVATNLSINAELNKKYADHYRRNGG